MKKAELEEEIKKLKFENESLSQELETEIKIRKSNERILKSQEEYIHLLENELKQIKEKASRAGRKKKDNKTRLEKINAYRAEGKTMNEISKLIKCSERTVYRILKGSNENMDNNKNKEFGRLGYNGHNDRYGILNRMDLWEDEGLHCGTGLDIVIDDEIIHTRIEMKGKNTWYLVDTGLEGEELEGIKVVIK